MDAPVTITVKSPVQSTDTQVQMPLSSTVLQLKQRLQQDHPAKPEPTSQRLIYSGRLLRDEEVLSDVFLPSSRDLPIICHLVIRPPAAAPTAPMQNAPQPQFPQMGQPQFPQQNQYPGAWAQMQYAQAPGMQQQQPNPFVLLQQQQQLLAQLQQQRMAQMNGGIAPPAGGAGIRVRININFSLIFKLALLVFVLGQGGGSERMAFLIAGAIFIYIWQQRNAVVNQNVDPDQDPAIQQAQQQAQQQQQQPPAQQNPPDAPAAPPAAGAVPPSPFSRFVNYDWREQGGIVGQVFGFFVPFFCSLVPSWQPNWPDYQAWVHQRQQQQQQQELLGRMQAELQQQGAPQ
eukprot:TRINITY_DN685_c0_g2_i2.p1 TRINITY_DN685_c0_g2~~TRINITY_DN685_c0_g2_i2.p1  ORF type:complete len:344 (-),score=83.62 TRINITY_DN685_c0_g2_i2:57-1088(-)